jgi:serine/threonine protein kinase
MSSPHTSSDKKIELVGDYQIKNRIGQGSFAVVYKAQHKVKIKIKDKQKVQITNSVVRTLIKRSQLNV